MTAASPTTTACGRASPIHQRATISGPMPHGSPMVTARRTSGKAAGSEGWGMGRQPVKRTSQPGAPGYCGLEKANAGPAIATLPAYDMVGRHTLGRQGPGARDRAASCQRRRGDVRVDEPRGPGRDRQARGSRVLQPLPWQAVAQGRRIRAHPEGARDPARLRQRRRVAENHATRARARHCLPHRSAQLLLPEARRRPVGEHRSGAQRPRRDLQVSATMSGTLPNQIDVLARVADVIASRQGGDPDKSYVARLFHKGTDTILKKVGEEATETVLAAKDLAAAPASAEARQALVGELAD